MSASSRAARKNKRKKTNRILNTAIAVVMLLIVIVGFTIFAGSKEEPEEGQVPQKQTAAEPEAPAEEPAGQTEEPDSETEQPAVEEKPAEEPATEQEVIVTEGTEPNVAEDIVDPAWEPVGTEQSGQHTSSFEMDSVDWDEKEQALSYATGIPRDNMTVWYISGNGPQGAIGTVSTKTNQNEAYRVHIEWVDGEGWKPVKVQKLKENDKGR